MKPVSENVPTESELRQAYVEASGASMAQESYYAEQVAEFERGIARIKAEALREALLSEGSVERAARSLFYGDIDPDLDVTWATAHEVVRTEYLAMARGALTAAIGDE